MKGRILRDRLATALLWACMGTTLAILGGILLFLVVRGAGTLSWEFFTQPPRDSMTKGGILTPLIGKLMERGLAYRSDDGSVYFSVSAWPAYGKLAHLDRSALLRRGFTYQGIGRS